MLFFSNASKSQNSKNYFKSFFILAPVVTPLFFAIMVLPGCAPTIEQQGFTRELVDFKKIQPGVHTQEQVREILGSPSTIAPFSDKTEEKWYYISKTISSKAFLRAKTLDQHIFVISFTPGHVVSDVKEIRPDEVTPVAPVARETQSSGYETGVLREVFGGFGRMGSKKPTR